MNERAQEALVEAALSGIPQAKGVRKEGEAYCALGIIFKKLLTSPWDSNFPLAGISEERVPTPCIAAGCREVLNREGHLITHLNNEHSWDFLTIARKMGPNAVNEEISA